VSLGVDQEHDRFVCHFFDRRSHSTRVQGAVAAIDHHDTRLRDHEAARSRTLIRRESVDTILDLVKPRAQFLGLQGQTRAQKSNANEKNETYSYLHMHLLQIDSRKSIQS
jgi:hypothetical protein